MTDISKAFTDISLNVVPFLQGLDCVSSVQFVDRSPASVGELKTWETTHYPYKLPDDLKSFLMLSNGLFLRWHFNFKEELLPLGCVHINGIKNITLIKDSFKLAPKTVDDKNSKKRGRTENSNDKTVNDGDDESETESETDDDEIVVMHKGKNVLGGNGKGIVSHTTPSTPVNKHGVVGFDLDTICMDGRVALLYTSPSAPPEVWYQDLSCTWYYVARSFSDYFRLLIMHLGLPHWQSSYTDTGMDPVFKQWFRFLSRERLVIDLDNARVKHDYDYDDHNLMHSDKINANTSTSNAHYIYSSSSTSPRNKPISDKNSTSDGVIEGDSNQMEFRINLTKIDKYASRFAQRNSGDGSNSRRRRRDDTDNELCTSN